MTSIKQNLNDLVFKLSYSKFVPSEIKILNYVNQNLQIICTLKAQIIFLRNFVADIRLIISKALN